MSAKTAVLTINSGDSKLDLFAQLMNIGRRDSDNRRIHSAFSVKTRYEIDFGQLKEQDDKLQIIGMTAEDGSGDGWIITGYYDGHEWDAETLAVQPGRGTFEGYYNTRTRKGRLTVTYHYNH
jgi:hypothetical protein